ncbi:hypothetical protein SAMN05421805_108122 [Saccharopolyspora antimicrobica]|uniref:DUF3558 domain-containing protein n=1 Tax=Saccharopolyspora antimicrobica TaxID=455193 RepID=A0A1I5DFR3_9PSEU|nr:hypothetical protein ATL45_3468 [Saccharopolyspora antimicrobica]SFN98032.1 hypothetical protein SAMN05421805_108122 [Saccharopolyspora antimicrobica]
MVQPQQPGQWGPQHPQAPQQVQPWQPVPKKKSRAGCITFLILGLVALLVVGGIAGVYFYWRHGIVTEPAGEEPSGQPVIAPCDLVSAETLRKLHTTNLIHGYSDEETGSATCTWRATKGQDGTNERYLDITVSTSVAEDPADALAEAEETFEHYRQTDGKRASRVTDDLEGPWDEAFMATGTEVKAAMVIFRKGSTTVSVGYDGYDKTYWFEDQRLPAPDAERAAKTAAEEFAAGL